MSLLVKRCVNLVFCSFLGIETSWNQIFFDIQNVHNLAPKIFENGTHGQIRYKIEHQWSTNLTTVTFLQEFQNTLFSIFKSLQVDDFCGFDWYINGFQFTYGDWYFNSWVWSIPEFIENNFLPTVLVQKVDEKLEVWPGLL